MPLKGQAFLALWNDIRREREAEYDHWHTTEHVPERVAVTGFHGARRYVSRRREHHRYFTLYEVADLAVFESPEYADLLANPTPWSASMRPDFSNFLRATCRVLDSQGEGIGAAVATVCFESTHVDAPRVAASLARVRDRPGVTAVHWGSGEGGLPPVPWREALGQSAPVRAFDRVVLIEALDRDAAAHALTEVRAELGLSALPTDFGADVYDLAFAFPGADAGERLRHRRPHWQRAPE